jgi:ketosteroid isomerase-like protein
MLLRIPRLKEKPMNRTIRLTFLALTMGLMLLAMNANRGSATQPATPAQEAAIKGILARQQTAWNQGNVEAFMQGYWNSPELTFAGTTGITRGYAPISAHYKQGYPDKAAMGHLDFTDLEVHSLGGAAALVLGKWHLTRDDGNIGGVFSLVFQKFPDGWKIVHDHTSQSAPAKP